VLFRKSLVVVVALSLLFGAGCATQGQTEALTGAGAGALVGGLANMHGSWGATTLTGAGVGAGVLHGEALFAHNGTEKREEGQVAGRHFFRYNIRSSVHMLRQFW